MAAMFISPYDLEAQATTATKLQVESRMHKYITRIIGLLVNFTTHITMMQRIQESSITSSSSAHQLKNLTVIWCQHASKVTMTTFFTCYSSKKNIFKKKCIISEQINSNTLVCHVFIPY
ncbi:hypothetical protein ACJX0J_030862, partial [Zea mays]